MAQVAKMHWRAAQDMKANSPHAWPAIVPQIQRDVQSVSYCGGYLEMPLLGGRNHVTQAEVIGFSGGEVSARWSDV